MAKAPLSSSLPPITTAAEARPEGLVVSASQLGPPLKPGSPVDGLEQVRGPL